MYYLIVSRLFIRQVSWLIELKCCPKSPRWEWTMLTARVIMLISMGIRWTCMLFRHIWLRPRLSSVLVTKCMKIQQTASHFDKSSKMQSFQPSIYLWETSFSKNQIIANCSINPSFLCLPKSQKTWEYSFWTQQFKSLSSYGQASNWSAM